VEYFGNIWQALRSTTKGLSVVARHLLRPKVTRQYPEPKDRYEMPERARNRLYVNMDDCIGCDKCARACPVNCITIDTAKAVPGENLGITSNGRKKALWVTRFDIDIAKCCYCSLCVWPCPTECIVMTDVFEFSGYNRGEMIYDFATMDRQEAAVHIENARRVEEETKAQRAKQAADRAAATAAAAAAAPHQPAEGAQPSQPQSGLKPPPFRAPQVSSSNQIASSDPAAGDTPEGVKPPPFRAKPAPPQDSDQSAPDSPTP
jgi:NADH-quinone oxidoreductase subunit I